MPAFADDEVESTPVPAAAKRVLDDAEKAIERNRKAFDAASEESLAEAEKSLKQLLERLTKEGKLEEAVATKQLLGSFREQLAGTTGGSAPQASAAAKTGTARRVPKPQRQQVPRVVVLTDEAELKKGWALKGDWRIEGSGVRLICGGEASMQSLDKYKDDFTIQFTYEKTHWCELQLRVWGETLVFGKDGLNVVNLMRRGDTITYAVGRNAPTIVKLKQENLETESSLSLVAKSLGAHPDRREILIRDMRILARETVAADVADSEQQK